MKKFFEEYGFVILASFIVILLIAVAGPIGDVIKDNISHIIEGFEDKTVQKLNSVMTDINLKPKDIITIKNKDFIILENKGQNKYLVLGPKTKKEIFDNNYETSAFKKYLNNEYYKELIKTVPEKAIIPQTIEQKIHKSDNFNVVLEQRKIDDVKVFLSSIDELKIIVDIDNEKEVKEFLHNLSIDNENGIWLRDASEDKRYAYYVDRKHGRLYRGGVNTAMNGIPAFVLDLSKVSYTVK